MSWWLLVMLIIAAPQEPMPITVKFGPFESEAECMVGANYGAFSAVKQIFESTGRKATPHQFACIAKSKGVET